MKHILGSQYPIKAFIQLVDEFGVPDEDKCWPSAHDAVVHTQIGETVKNPVVVDGSQPIGVRKIEGIYRVDDRQMVFYFDAYATGASITIYLRLI